MDNNFENEVVEIVDVEENLDMLTMFDDCESGFLAKKDKLITWILS